jgi:hypothetical protein
VLHHVNINTWPERTVKLLALNTLYNLLNGEIRGVGALTMQERGGDPNFISNFQFGAERNCHRSRLCTTIHLYQVLMKCQD